MILPSARTNVAGDDGAVMPRERIRNRSEFVKSILAVILTTEWAFDEYDCEFCRESRKTSGA
jgi:hypothetical protein